MAVAPLFVADMTTLKNALRLEGLSTAGALAVLDQAVLDVRVRLYGRLTASRITTIKGTAYTDTPTTDAELLRALANSVEIRWVLLLGLRRLPTQFMDSAGGRVRRWNEESAFLHGKDPVEEEIRRLEAEIEEDLGKLEGDDAITDDPTINVATIGPAVTPDLPGGTIWTSLRNPDA